MDLFRVVAEVGSLDIQVYECLFTYTRSPFLSDTRELVVAFKH